MSKTRAPARDKFYADIICTAAEGGVQLVDAQVTDWEMDADGNYLFAIIRFPDINASHSHILRFDHDAVARAFAILRNRVGPVDAAWSTRLLATYNSLDGGEIDAIDALQLAELAHFGSIFYA